MSIARLNKQKAQIEKGGYTLKVESDSVWVVQLTGPKETPFEGGKFQLQFKFENFPFKGPVVICRTKAYHPNIMDNGELCRQMIQVGNNWAPTKKLVTVIEKIMSLFVAPNLDTPVNPQAAQDYKNGKWEQKAKQFTQQFAK